MTDLTRLMFDDGANREPIAGPVGNTFMLGTRLVSWRLLAPEEISGNSAYLPGFNLYSGPTYATSRFHLTKFQEDPETYMSKIFGYYSREGKLPMNEAFRSDIVRGDIAFIVLEFV